MSRCNEKGDGKIWEQGTEYSGGYFVAPVYRYFVEQHTSHKRNCRMVLIFVLVATRYGIHKTTAQDFLLPFTR